jgi:hypothetical protein
MKTIDFAYPSVRLGRSLAVSLTDGEFTHGPHVLLSAIHFPRGRLLPIAPRGTSFN